MRRENGKFNVTYYNLLMSCIEQT